MTNQAKAKITSPSLRSFIDQGLPGQKMVYIRLATPDQTGPNDQDHEARKQECLDEIQRIIQSTPLELARFGLVIAQVTSQQLKQLEESSMVAVLQAGER